MVRGEFEEARESISHIEKGRKAELEYAEILKSKGYEVCLNNNAAFKKKDFFGLFDIIAMNKDEILFIQVRCNRTLGAIKKIANFNNHPTFIIKQVVVKYDDGLWEIFPADKYPTEKMIKSKEDAV